MPSAPIYTNFEGERAPKKNAIFLSKFFKKCPKTAFLTVFSEICLRRRKFSQNGGKKVLWESSKNQFGRPKKKKGRQNFRIFFENPPLLEKILDPPLVVVVCFVSKFDNICTYCAFFFHLLTVNYINKTCSAQNISNLSKLVKYVTVFLRNITA